MGAEVISRVADHCFWFGRYLERAESTARTLFVTRNLALDAELTPRACWLPVIIVSGEEEAFLTRFGDDAAGDGETVERYLAWDDETMVSIHRSVGAARENARSIREVVSQEAWETINELHLWLSSAAARAEYANHRYGYYRRVRESIQLCLGLLRSTMLHDTALDFIWLGVLLERVGQTARVLDVHHHALVPQSQTAGAAGAVGASSGPAHEVVETAMWMALLRACSGVEPFLKRNQGRVTGASVAAFLILELRFPRSVRYCVHSAYDRLCAIRPPEERTLPGGQTLERLRVLERWLSSRTQDSLWAGIHDLLTHIVDETTAICEGIGRELLGWDPPAPPTPAPPTQTQAQG